MADPKETWYCRACGGTDVRHDAIVIWNPERQAWDVVSVLDDTWCETCDEAGGTNTGDPTFGIPGQTDHLADDTGDLPLGHDEGEA